MTDDEVVGDDTEAELLRQARLGSEEALGRLYADHVQAAEGSRACRGKVEVRAFDGLG